MCGEWLQREEEKGCHRREKRKEKRDKRKEREKERRKKKNYEYFLECGRRERDNKVH